MELGIKVYIPNDIGGNNNIKEYIMRLYCEEFKCFGEPLILTCQIDDDQYNEQMESSKLSLDDKEMPRVTARVEETENFEVARQLADNAKTPFLRALNELRNAASVRNNM